MKRQFCSYCGAGIGKYYRPGEGQCPKCAPLACWWNKVKRWLVGL